MRTVSYSLDLPIPGRYYALSSSFSVPLDVNTKYHCGFKKRQDEKCFTGDKLGIAIKIQLVGGEVTGLTSSSRLYNTKELSDVEVKCGDWVISAHRNVLSVHSDTLRTVFSSPRFVEGKTGVYTVKKEHMSPEILEDVVKWMYQQSIDDAPEKVADLLDAAEYFQIEGLKEICSQMLTRTLSVTNCLQLLDTAFKYNLKQLKKLATDILVPNRLQVLDKIQNLADVTRNIPPSALEMLEIEPESS